MKAKNQLRHLVEIIENYKFQKPLIKYLKQYFRNHKNFGSRDRRFYTDLVFNYFRLSKGFKNLPKKHLIVLSNYLAEKNTSEFSTYFLKEFFNIEPKSFSVEEKIKQFQNKNIEFSFEEIFPSAFQISNKINLPVFLQSFLHQPKIWIRTKNKFHSYVLEDLEKNQIKFQFNQNSPNCLLISKANNLYDLKSFKKGFFEIQDLASQQTKTYFKAQNKEIWWDCCAGSGGKSLLLSDINQVKLYVSDSRAKILDNLKHRFKRNKIQNYQHAIVDLTKANPLENQKHFPLKFDGIILDVPCSGSGTWQRNPEKLFQFKPNKLQYFQSKQEQIANNIYPYLKKNKPLIYITCSVYEAENEAVVNKLVKSKKYQLEEMNYLEPQNFDSNTLFVARLIAQ